MRLNPKGFGLVAVAVLLASATMASAASGAADFTASAYPSTVIGLQTGANVWSNGVREVTCSEASLTGTLGGPSKTITIEPKYNGCTGNAGTTLTVDTSGCDYTLTVTQETTAATGHGTMTIECEAGKTIDISVWAPGKTHSEATLCTLTVGTQGPLAAVEYHNRVDAGGKPYVELTFTIGTLTLIRDSGTAANCGAATKTNATFVGTIDTISNNGANTGLMVG